MGKSIKSVPGHEYVREEYEEHWWDLPYWFEWVDLLWIMPLVLMYVTGMAFIIFISIMGIREIF